MISGRTGARRRTAGDACRAILAATRWQAAGASGASESVLTGTGSQARDPGRPCVIRVTLNSESKWLYTGTRTAIGTTELENLNRVNVTACAVRSTASQLNLPP